MSQSTDRLAGQVKKTSIKKKKIQKLPRSPNCLFMIENSDCHMSTTFTKVISKVSRLQQSQNQGLQVQVYGIYLRSGYFGNENRGTLYLLLF